VPPVFLIQRISPYKKNFTPREFIHRSLIRVIDDH